MRCMAYDVQTSLPKTSPFFKQHTNQCVAMYVLRVCTCVYTRVYVRVYVRLCRMRCLGSPRLRRLWGPITPLPSSTTPLGVPTPRRPAGSYQKSPGKSPGKGSFDNYVASTSAALDAKYEATGSLLPQVGTKVNTLRHPCPAFLSRWLSSRHSVCVCVCLCVCICVCEREKERERERERKREREREC